MKNSLQLLALGLVLFLGACSVTETNEDKFLNKVKGKTAYNSKTTQDDTTAMGTFSADGKDFDGSVFVNATDDNTGKYKGSSTVTYIIKTTDGITGTLSQEGASGSEQDMYFKK